MFPVVADCTSAAGEYQLLSQSLEVDEEEHHIDCPFFGHNLRFLVYGYTCVPKIEPSIKEL